MMPMMWYWALIDTQDRTPKILLDVCNWRGNHLITIWYVGIAAWERKCSKKVTLLKKSLQKDSSFEKVVVTEKELVWKRSNSEKKVVLLKSSFRRIMLF